MFTEFNSNFQKTSLSSLYNSFLDLWTLHYSVVETIETDRNMQNV
jgi:hypothetical protein